MCSGRATCCPCELWNEVRDIEQETGIKTRISLGNESILIQLVVANTFLEEYSFKCNNIVVIVLAFLRGCRCVHTFPPFASASAKLSDYWDRFYVKLF